jgi:hypothetical protein
MSRRAMNSHLVDPLLATRNEKHNKAFVEIKPDYPSQRELQLLRELHQASKIECICLYGPIGEDVGAIYIRDEKESSHTGIKALYCIATFFSARSEKLLDQIVQLGDRSLVGKEAQSIIGEELAKALDAAIGARFEFGESGGGN